MILAPGTIFAGALQDFEKDATKTKSEEFRDRSSRSSHDCEQSDSSNDEIFEELFLKPLLVTVVYGGAESLKRTEGAEAQGRKPGEALIPFLRFDGGYEAVEHEIKAGDIRAEAGYAFGAVAARTTRFWERGTGDTMTATELHLLYRMSFGSKFECDLGLGKLILEGMRTTKGTSWTVPLLFHPSEHYGFEFRPTWANLNGNTLEDYDLAALIGGRYLSLKIGYRWFLSDYQSLSGPQAGLSLRW